MYQFIYIIIILLLVSISQSQLVNNEYSCLTTLLNDIGQSGLIPIVNPKNTICSVQGIKCLNNAVTELDLKQVSVKTITTTHISCFQKLNKINFQNFLVSPTFLTSDNSFKQNQVSVTLDHPIVFSIIGTSVISNINQLKITLPQLYIAPLSLDLFKDVIDLSLIDDYIDYNNDKGVQEVIFTQPTFITSNSRSIELFSKNLPSISGFTNVISIKVDLQRDYIFNTYESYVGVDSIDIKTNDFNRLINPMILERSSLTNVKDIKFNIGLSSTTSKINLALNYPNLKTISIDTTSSFSIISTNDFQFSSVPTAIEKFILRGSKFNRIDSAFNILSNVPYIDLSNNGIINTLPLANTLNNYSNSVLNLSNNKLYGTLDESYCKIYNLDISNNQLTGEIPKCFTCFMKNNNQFIQRFIGNQFTNYHSINDNNQCNDISPSLKVVGNKVYLEGSNLGFDNSITSTPSLKFEMITPSTRFVADYTQYIGQEITFTITFALLDKSFKIRLPSARPKVDFVNTTPDGLTSLYGSDFSNDKSQIRVSIGDYDCMVLSSSFGFLECQMPSDAVLTSKMVSNIYIDTPSSSFSRGFIVNYNSQILSTTLIVYCSNDCNGGICNYETGICSTLNNENSLNIDRNSQLSSSSSSSIENPIVFTGLENSLDIDSGSSKTESSSSIENPTSSSIIPNSNEVSTSSKSSSKEETQSLSSTDNSSNGFSTVESFSSSSNLDSSNTHSSSFSVDSSSTGVDLSSSSNDENSSNTSNESSNSNIESSNSNDSTSSSIQNSFSSSFSNSENGLSSSSNNDSSNDINQSSSSGIENNYESSTSTQTSSSDINNNSSSNNGENNSSSIGSSSSLNNISSSSNNDSSSSIGKSSSSYSNTNNSQSSSTVENSNSNLYYLNSISPCTVEGGIVTLYGSFGFIHKDLKVLIGDVVCQNPIATIDTIKCRLNPGYGTKDINITQNGISIFRKNSFQYYNPIQTCPNDCTSRDNGECDRVNGGICICLDQWSGYDCSIPNVQDNKDYPKTITKVNIETGSVSLSNENTNFDISIISLVELDVNGNTIKTNHLKKKWDSDQVLFNEINNTYQFTQQIQNNTGTITYIIELVQQDKKYQFDTLNLSIDKGGVKISVNISNYQYQSLLNTIQLRFLSKSSEIENILSNKCNERPSQSDTSNIDINKILNYISISMNSKILLGQYINRVISNGKATFITNEVIKELTNSSAITIGLNLPNCKECIIDPEYSVLVESNYKINCDDSGSNRKWMIISVAVVVPVIVVSVLVLASVLFYRKHRYAIRLFTMKRSISMRRFTHKTSKYHY